MKRITEDSIIDFSEYKQLSYIDNCKNDVILFVDDKSVGKIKVFLDSEEDGREYICINNEIVYLDMLTEKYK